MVKGIAILAIIMVFAMSSTIGGSNLFGLLLWIIFLVRLRSLLTKTMSNPRRLKLPCPQCGAQYRDGNLFSPEVFVKGNITPENIRICVDK